MSDFVTIADWYQVKLLRPGLWQVHEPEHVSFFVLTTENGRGLFIDSGLGIAGEAAVSALLEYLSIDDFDVINTHAHCDHVGLNYRAQSVALTGAEWSRFQNNAEKRLIGVYYDWVKHDMPWPAGMVTSPKQGPWLPTAYVGKGAQYECGGRYFEVLATPGHCGGHIALYHEAMHVLFLGDLIYKETLFLHLSDSSLREYQLSLGVLRDFINRFPNPPRLLPCHGSIPLDAAYIDQVSALLTRVRNGEVKGATESFPTEFFDDALVFSEDGVRVAIKQADLSVD